MKFKLVIDLMSSIFLSHFPSFFHYFLIQSMKVGRSYTLDIRKLTIEIQMYCYVLIVSISIPLDGNELRLPLSTLFIKCFAYSSARFIWFADLKECICSHVWDFTKSSSKIRYGSKNSILSSVKFWQSKFYFI